ncbi:hypothetical protein [Kitasatospora sp. NPDC004289]
MRALTRDEECLLVNAREGTELWAVLADRAETEEDEERDSYVPLFTALITDWTREGYVRLRRGGAWPHWLTDGRDVPVEEVPAVLADPASWAYEEEPVSVVAVVVGARPVDDLF